MDSAALLPPTWRIVAGFLVAPLVAALAMAFVEPLFNGLPFSERVYRTTIVYCVFGAYPSTVILGLPAFFLLRRRVRASPINCALAGACVAALPWLVLWLVSTPDYSFDGGHVAVANGHTTGWGWIELVEMLLEMPAFGGLAGAAFWLVASAGVEKQARAPS
jgi:hypothetical protein